FSSSFSSWRSIFQTASNLVSLRSLAACSSGRTSTGNPGTAARLRAAFLAAACCGCSSPCPRRTCGRGRGPPARAFRLRCTDRLRIAVLILRHVDKTYNAYLVGADQVRRGSLQPEAVCYGQEVRHILPRLYIVGYLLEGSLYGDVAEVKN